MRKRALTTAKINIISYDCRPSTGQVYIKNSPQMYIIMFDQERFKRGYTSKATTWGQLSISSMTISAILTIRFIKYEALKVFVLRNGIFKTRVELLYKEMFGHE